MRIRKLIATEYRACRQTEFAPAPGLSVLIGPNGSGKTTVLGAIQLLRTMATDHPHAYRQGRITEAEPESSSTLEVWFEHNGHSIKYTANVELSTDDQNRDYLIDAKEWFYSWDLTGSRARLRLPLWAMTELRDLPKAAVYRRGYWHLDPRKMLSPAHSAWDSSKATEALELLRTVVSGIKYYRASQFTNPSSCPISFEADEQGNPARHVRQSGHMRYLVDCFQADRGGSKRYADYLDLVGPDGIALVDQIEFQPVTTSSSEYRVRVGGRYRKQESRKMLVIPRFHVGKQVLSPNQLSEGTLKTLALLYYLITDTSAILLIEEPEVCVHHGLLSSIIELIRAYSEQKQIIISTHSEAVLDEVDPSSVYCVSNKGAQGIKVKALSKAMSKKELAALREYLRSEGNLGEYWRSGGIDG